MIGVPMSVPGQPGLCQLLIVVTAVHTAFIAWWRIPCWISALVVPVAQQVAFTASHKPDGGVYLNIAPAYAHPANCLKLSECSSAYVQVCNLASLSLFSTVRSKGDGEWGFSNTSRDVVSHYLFGDIGVDTVQTYSWWYGGRIFNPNVRNGSRGGFDFLRLLFAACFYKQGPRWERHH